MDIIQGQALTDLVLGKHHRRLLGGTSINTTTSGSAISGSASPCRINKKAVVPPSDTMLQVAGLPRAGR